MTPAFAKAAEDMAVERLQAGERVRFIARGRSMWPFILDGDLLVIGPIKHFAHRWRSCLLVAFCCAAVSMIWFFWSQA